MIKAAVFFVGLAFLSGQAGMILVNALEMFAEHHAEIEVVLDEAY